MKKPTFKALIASYHRAEREERQTELRRQRRLSEIKLAARRERTRVDIVLGAEARQFGRGDMSSGEFRGRIDVAEKALAEIDQALASVGLDKAASERVGSTQVEAESNVNSAEKEWPMITVAFWSKACKELREALPAQCGIHYQPDEIVWRGRADRALVEKIIEQHGETGRVRYIA